MVESDKPGARAHLERPIITEREKPALDEATFQQLLEAAHVLQAQRGFDVASRPSPDPAEALTEILETQEFLRSQTDDLQVAANVVVERLQKITHATGVAVAVVREKRLEYCAATGDAARLAGTSLAMDSSLSADGQLSTGFTQEHTDKQSIALPLHHDGKLTGLLEIRFADADSIQAPEMRSCQLMAGLMTEAIARAADKEWRQTLAAERAAMLEALERIKPQLERLAVEPSKDITVPKEEVVESAERVVEPAEANQAPRAQVPSGSSSKSEREAACAQCGYQFKGQELFCGKCGTARPARALLSGALQSKWASVRRLQQGAESQQREAGEKDGEQSGSAAIVEARPSPELSEKRSAARNDLITRFTRSEPEIAPDGDSELVISDDTAEDAASNSLALREGPKPPSPWASASQAHQWLESLHPKSAAGIWLAKHRADLYVGAAALMLLIVLSGWGMRPVENHSALKNAQPNLTFFEKVLVSLGLAETPTAPVYLGNPNAQVWVDLHTAQYYCSDSDLYGKTKGGKFTTQRDAQMDQFEPAARRNCD